MRLLSNEKIIGIMEQGLNCVDPRLADHGIRVAYLMYRILSPQKMYSGNQLRDICILAMLHDLGAHDVKEIDKMVVFDSKVEIWEHSIYSYLYQRHFSPLKDLAPVMLFHHESCKNVYALHQRYKMLAELISLTDRADIFAAHQGKTEHYNNHLKNYRDIKYSGYIVDMYLEADIQLETVFDEMKEDKVFNTFYRESPVDSDDTAGYIRMLCAFIDFRSSSTAAYSVVSNIAARHLAECLKLSEQDAEKTETLVAINNISRIAFPADSLKKLYKMDSEAKEKHLKAAKTIFEGNVESSTLNLTLKPGDLNSIIYIADLFAEFIGNAEINSYPGDILPESVEDLARAGAISKEMADIASCNCDDIILKSTEAKERQIVNYNKINKEFINFKGIIELNDYKLLAKAAMF